MLKTKKTLADKDATKQDRSPRVTHSQDLKTTVIMLEKVKPVDIYVKET